MDESFRCWPNGCHSPVMSNMPAVNMRVLRCIGCGGSIALPKGWNLIPGDQLLTS